MAASRILLTDAGEVQLNPDAVTVDAIQFADAIQRSQQVDTLEKRGRELTRAVELYRGPLLPAFYEAWALRERTCLEQTHESHTGDTAQIRFGMLETILNYARERFADSPADFAVRRAHRSYYVTLAKEAREHPGAQQETKARGDALHGAGNLAIAQRDKATATAWYEESLAVRHQIGDHQGAAALDNLAIVASNSGNYARARAMHEEALG